MTLTEKKKVINLLKKSKARFESSKNIVKDWSHFAEDKDGNYITLSLVNSNNKDICRTCILGSLLASTNQHYSRNYYEASNFLGDAHDLLFPERTFFQKHTLKEIHKVFDKAIELAENE
jgi:hypothetical protein